MPATLNAASAARTKRWAPFAFNAETGEVFHATPYVEWTDALTEWHQAMVGRPNCYWHPSLPSPMPPRHLMFDRKAKGYEKYAKLDAPPEPLYEHGTYRLYAGQHVGWQTFRGEWFNGVLMSMDPTYVDAGDEPHVMLRRWDGGTCCLPVAKLME